MDKYTSIKREFYNWISAVDKTRLNKFDIRLLNILISNFDKLAPLGTSGGARARKLVKLIEQKSTTDCNLFDVDNTSLNQAEVYDNIREIKIGPFRGFSKEITFVFTKQYTFMYGPNGSGKSSFCEGIEFALLGSIEEAEAKRIDIYTYMQNIKAKKSVPPVARACKPDGSLTDIPQNPEAYRFCFIEKNRIDNFARMAATTAKAQLDLIATLFGLDAFNEFVNGFTKDLNNYIVLNNKKREEFENEQKTIEASKDLLNEAINEKDLIQISLKSIFEELSVPEVNTVEDIRLYLSGVDGLSGRLGELHKKKAEIIPDNIDSSYYEKILKKLESLEVNLSELEILESSLISLSTEVNYKELYSAIKAVSEDLHTDKTICPACKTPIEKVVVNPFIFADAELNKMKELKNLQLEIESKNQGVYLLIKNINKEINELNAELKGLGESKIVTYPSFSDNTEKKFSIAIVKAESETIKEALTNADSVDILFEIKTHNDGLNKKRIEKRTVDEDLKKLSEIKAKVDKIEAAIKAKTAEIEKLTKRISDFNSLNADRLLEIAKVDNQIKENEAFTKSYAKLINNLKSYRNDLPVKLAKGLTEKSKEYYNIINSHDPDFEYLEKLILPSSPGDKILVQFKGEDTQYDALQILSEGHIKVLGLSILLSKVVNNNIGFIIYDDIVNAIDDEHRNGVAELIIRHIDFKIRQHIITCHGENFISKLEQKLGASLVSKNVQSYRFMPSDCYEERGVKVFVGNSKHSLILANEALNNNDLKDAAFRCRQTMEILSEQLWKKLSKTLKVDLHVNMRGPKQTPDLYSVVDGLISTIKTIKGLEDLSTHLKLIKEKYNWMLLNKGTHAQSDLPEFERKDISEIIGLLTTIELEIVQLKLDVCTRPA